MKKYTKNAVIWVKKDKNDKPFFSFKAERDIKSGESLNFFKNDKGDNPARPDYRSYSTDEDTQVEDEIVMSSKETEAVANDVPF